MAHTLDRNLFNGDLAALDPSERRQTSETLFKALCAASFVAARAQADAQDLDFDLADWGWPPLTLEDLAEAEKEVATFDLWSESLTDEE